MEDVQGLEHAPEGTPSEGTQGLDNTNDVGSPESSRSAAEKLVLDKSETFIYKGKEYKTSDFEKGWQRQSDYTKKTQALAEERARIQQEYQQTEKKYEEYINNIEADVKAVVENPSLYSKFKEIYPKMFHSIMDRELQKASTGSGTRDNVNTQTQSQRARDPYLEARLNQIESNFQKQSEEKAAAAFNAEVASSETMLNTVCESMATKYPFADEDAILAKAEYQVAKMPEVNQQALSSLMDKLYSESHKAHEARYQAHYKGTVEKQKQANKTAKDMGPGGGIPAKAPERMKFKDVKHHLSKLASEGKF